MSLNMRLRSLENGENILEWPSQGEAMLRKFVLVVLGIGLGALAALWLVGERGHLMQRSTRRLLHEKGWRYFFSVDFWHSYIYGRWSNQYIGLGIRHAFPAIKPADGQRGWADVYHGKILPTELAQALVSFDHHLPLQDLEQIIPYPTARNIVLDGPPDIAVYECPCRHARETPCQPTQVCMVVGQPFVDFVLEHNPHSSKRLTQPEALALLQAEHERGHLHAAYFKDVMLDRFYAICNCCKCCCGGIESMVKHGVPMLTSSGFVAQIDDDACEHCGNCENVCPFDAIVTDSTVSVAWDKCMGCGVCQGQCPYDAIALVRDERKGIPLDVRVLAESSPITE